MTQQELINCRKRYLRAAAIPCASAIVAIPAIALVMSRWEGHHADWPPGFWLAAIVLVIVVFVALFWFVFTHERRVASRCGLRCPHCKKTFVGVTNRVLASGRCVHCGERILDDVA